MKILSIDPGLVNMGICIIDTDTKRILRLDTISLAESAREFNKKSSGGESSIISRLYDHLFTKIDFRSIDVVLIERQMRRLMLLIQFCIGTYCEENKIKYVFVAPTLVKRHFRTSTLSHFENKRAALAMCRRSFPDIANEHFVHGAKNDDMADALLQGVWYCDTYKY